MRYRAAGGLDVSVLVLGAASFGGLGSARRLVGQGDSAADAHALLDHALALGITAIDTAGTYGDGASEQILGAWLRARGPAVRQRVRILSKVGIRGGLGRAHVEAELDRTLARLGVEAVAGYLAHVPDPATPWAAVGETFARLAERGKLRCYGASNVDAAALPAGFTVVENQHNLLHRDATLTDGRAYLAYSPLAGGLLGGAYQLDGAIPDGSRIALRRDLYAAAWTPASARRVERLRAAATERAVAPATLATWWLLQDPRVTAVIAGPRRPAQLDELVAALALPPDPALWHALGAA